MKKSQKYLELGRFFSMRSLSIANFESHRALTVCMCTPSKNVWCLAILIFLQSKVFPVQKQKFVLILFFLATTKFCCKHETLLLPIFAFFFIFTVMFVFAREKNSIAKNGLGHNFFWSVVKGQLNSGKRKKRHAQCFLAYVWLIFFLCNYLWNMCVFLPRSFASILHKV